MTHQILMDGVTKGLKVDRNNIDYESEDGLKLKALQKHVFRFSACKNYEEVTVMSRALTDEKGNVRSFDDFRKEAAKIDAVFNGRWLRTEYDQAVVTSTRIGDYNRMEKNTDLFPTWQYKTRNDGHVREPHLTLHNMKMAANDPAWDSIYPPNGWNCRCWIKPLSEDPPSLAEGQVAIDKLQRTIINKKTGMSEWDNMVKQGFNQNPATSNSVFPKNHPYWKAAKAFSVVKAAGEFDAAKFETVESFKNGGKIQVHTQAGIDKNDFPELLKIAEHFAKEGKTVKILPKPYKDNPLYDEIFGQLKGTIYERKCPDLKIGKHFYEYESFDGEFNKTKLRKMMNRGLKQSSRIIINVTDLATDHHIRKVIYNRIDEGHMIDEVWLHNGKDFRLFYKKQ